MKKVLVTGLNYNQIPYLKEIKKLGFEIIGTDGNANPVGKSLCNEFYNVSYTDLNSLLEIVKKEEFNEFDFLFSASSQESYITLSKIGEFLNIDFPENKNIETALSKVKLYKFFEKKGIPFPKTEFVKNENELFKKIKNKSYYLKSDYSKNPNYVYKINKNSDFNKINWKKDRYFKEFYILQEEFIGSHLRFNIFDNFFTLFDFKVEDGNKITIPSDVIFEKVKKLTILNYLKDICEILKLDKFLVKFDVILGENEFAVLDVGIDPPFRMKKFYDSKNIDFPKYYVEHYLKGQCNYPIRNKI